MKERRRRGLLVFLVLIVLCWVLPAAAAARPDRIPLDQGVVEIQPTGPDLSAPAFAPAGSNVAPVDLGNTGNNAGPGFWAGLWGHVKGGLGSAWNWTGQVAGTAWNWTKDTAGIAWDWTKQTAFVAWDWVQGVGVHIGNWWDGLPDWVQGGLKGLGVALLVIAAVVVVIVLLPAEIVAGIVAAVGGIVVLIGAGVGALAGGTIYGAKVGGDHFNIGYAILSTIGGGIVGGALVSAPFWSLVGRALTGAGSLLSKTWAYLSRGWMLNKGWRGFLTKGFQSAGWGFITRLVLDALDGQFSPPSTYIHGAVSDFFFGALVNTFVTGFVDMQRAGTLRAFYNKSFFGGRLKPFQLLDSWKAKWTRFELWMQGVRGKELKKALFQAAKPTNTPRKGGRKWVGFVVGKISSTTLSSTRKLVNWLRRKKEEGRSVE